ncbi:DUF4867 family protein, partial [Treponema sp.]|uniref:DUF4867 family protein n=1 Tax=Treponema sp. TaxID=166 RepID=UPI0025DB75AD
MKVKSVYSKAFAKYGKVLEGYDTAALIEELKKTDKPAAEVIYEPHSEMEKLAIAGEFSANAYGGMPVEIGYCNGFNTKLNCLEYHRGSELNIPEQDMILLVASLADVKKGFIHSRKVEAFRVPAGSVVEVYETTLHYAPCCDVRGNEVSDGFRVAIVLPAETNTDKPDIKI